MFIQLCLAVGLAVTVSAICSVLEAALYSVPTTHLEVMEKNGLKAGTTLKNLKHEIHRPITAILTLNTIANTMGAAVAGAAAVAVFGDNNLVWFSVAFTLTILIFSEILPKTIGVAYSRELAPWIALPLKLIMKVLNPAIWFCHKITQLIPRHPREGIASAEEVMAIAALSHRAGEIDSQEERVITNILELKNKDIIDVMTPRTVSFVLDDKMNVDDAILLKEKLNLHSRIPIYNKEPDNVSGIVLRKDVLSAAADDMHSMELSTLAHPAHFVPETAPLSRVLLDFINKKQHLFIVVDEYGSMTGVVSMEDIIEEIFGQEIMDESDQTEDMRALARRQQQEKARKKN